MIFLTGIEFACLKSSLSNIILVEIWLKNTGTYSGKKIWMGKSYLEIFLSIVSTSAFLSPVIGDLFAIYQCQMITSQNS